MLSVSRCRELLGPEVGPISDAELAELRNQLTDFAGVLIGITEQDRVQPASRLSELLEDLDERAAIMEFDGGAKRSVAERMARLIVLRGGKTEAR